VQGASQIAKELGARMVIVVSHSGVTAQAMSKFRSLVPVVGVSGRESTLRQMCLVWGVVPLADAPTTDSIELIRYVEQWGVENGALRAGDHVVLVAGVGLASKGHNMVRVHTVGQDAG
jgi:pyruvate kinase